MNVPHHTTQLDFAALGVRPDILAAVRDLGFDTPTAIQQKVIPLLLDVRSDVVGLAQTGTGKTVAYGIPLIQCTDLGSSATQALVLCPTRELCLQVTRDLRALAKHVRGVVIEAVYGGASIRQQLVALRRGAHVVVATPGRLVDFLDRGAVQLDGLRTMVLDEADEMLSMGFRDELDAIVARAPAGKQSLLFSATTSPDVAAVASTHMHKPVQITVGKVNAASDYVQHHYYVVQASDRYAVIRRLADLHPSLYAIIFCRTRLETQDLAKRLQIDGYSAEALHGDLSQGQRDLVMGRFRARGVRILVATDVAARGLDVSDLSHVINYSLPDDMAVYTHRAGRTGRAGNTGTSICIIHTRERHRIRALERQLKVRFELRRVPTGPEICAKQLHHFIDTLENVRVDGALLEPYLAAIHTKLAGIDRATLIKRFVSVELSRFLTHYKAAPDLNVAADRDRHGLWEPPNAPSPRRPPQVRHGRPANERPSNFVRLTLNVGEDDGVTPSRLIGRINEATRNRSITIGRIELKRHATTFEADSRHAGRVCAVFEGSQINGKHVIVDAAPRRRPGASGLAKCSNRQLG